jgi:hypothetical protein
MYLCIVINLKYKGMCKFIESVSTDRVELEVYECECGFHIGIDASYLDQVGDVKIVCPSCKKAIQNE